MSYDVNRLKIDQIMTPSEKKLTGIEDLSSNQKDALEKWLTNWSLRLLSTGTSALSTENEKEIPEKSAMPSYDAVRDVNNNGNIELKKSGLFIISSVDKVTAANWLPGDKIKIEQSSSGRYPYKLRNLNTGTFVKAQITEEESIEASSEDSNDIDKHNFVLDGIEDDGSVLIFDDGSMWEVAPSVQYKLRSWNIGDNISIHKTGSMFYPYEINNKKQQNFVIAKRASNLSSH